MTNDNMYVVYKCGYDILSQVFFVVLFNKTYEIKEVKYFNSFDDYYAFLDGDIFTDSCYFGYDIISELEKRNIKIKKEIPISFIKDRIDDITYENIYKEKSKLDNHKNLVIKKRFDRLLCWYNTFPNEINYDLFLTIKREYKKKFSFFDIKILFSLLFKKYGDKLGELVTKYFINDIYQSDFSIKDILFNFDIEYFLEIIKYFKSKKENITKYEKIYCGEYEYNYLKRKLEYFKKLYNAFNNDGVFISKKYFDKDSLLFVVIEVLMIDHMPYRYERFFTSFSDFTNYLAGDLSNADLSNVDLSLSDLSKYIINSKTILPYNNETLKKVIEKKYLNKHFIVKIKWIDTNENEVLFKEFCFRFIADFLFFLNNDLSNANLIDCSNICNLKVIKGIKYDNVILKESDYYELGISKSNVFNTNYDLTCFEIPKKNEMIYIENTIDNVERFEKDKKFFYITDIHLEHRFLANNCKYIFEEKEVLKRIAIKLTNGLYNSPLFIGGDIASNFENFSDFIKILNQELKFKSGNKDIELFNVYENDVDNVMDNVFLTIGNHELWAFPNTTLSNIISIYKNKVSEYGCHFVYNNLFYFRDSIIHEISESELQNISIERLREHVKNSNLIVFGGIGFSGNNSIYNANSGIYRDIITREEEIGESKKFYNLYKKVCLALYDFNVIILTHMPFEDWCLEKRQSEFVYISGHNHHNYYFDDNITRVFSDNQIGYKQKEVNLKFGYIDNDFDYFSDYSDGIHEINRYDYMEFYNGIREGLTFTREYEKIYMIKRNDTYMFLMKNNNDNLFLLNGGRIRTLVKKDLKYYFDNIINYSLLIKKFIKEYMDYLYEISKEIQIIGGTGFIHGSIIDIDFYNHLFVNPYDGKITPYFAYSIVDKYVYNDIRTLLKYNREDLLNNFDKNQFNIIPTNLNSNIANKEKEYYKDTDMYKISYKILKMQQVYNKNVVRLWTDDLLSDSKNKYEIIKSIFEKEMKN